MLRWMYLFMCTLDPNPNPHRLQMLRWMYLFMCTLVLVNLLIAQMAETYGNVMAEGIMRWKYNRATLISEYKVPLTLALTLPSTRYP